MTLFQQELFLRRNCPFRLPIFMISLEEFKKALGSLSEQLSEEEILKLRENQDQMAEILFNSWLAEINNSKV